MKKKVLHRHFKIDNLNMSSTDKKMNENDFIICSIFNNYKQDAFKI